MKFKVICEWHSEHEVEMPDDYDVACIKDDIANGDSSVLDQVYPDTAELWGWEIQEED